MQPVDENLRKIYSEVFDKRTLDALYRLSSKKYFEYLDYPVLEGKEAKVFAAKTIAGTHIIVKIYKIETTDFKNMSLYIKDDPRFKSIRHSQQEIIHTWVRKEFANLDKFYSAGVPVPQPIAFDSNVLLMEMISCSGKPCPQLRSSPIPLSSLKSQLVQSLHKMFYTSKLIHADLSEYNILNQNNKAIIIDCGQSVSRRHPKAQDFFERDIQNLSKYLSKQGLPTTPESLKQEIKSLENSSPIKIKKTP